MDKVRVGESGESQTLTVTNVGERPMPISILGFGGGDSGEFFMEEDGCGAVVLAPEASCSLQLRFVPTAMGQRQTVLEIHAEMPDSPALLTISAQATAPLMSISPPGVNFGPRDVGENSDPADLVVSNEGTAPLQIQRVALAGVAERDFRLTQNGCSKTVLEPGETCALRLVFIPRAAGVRRAAVILDSDALEPVPTAELEGEGVWTGAAFAVQPKAVEFGRHLVDTQALRQSVQVVNRQATALQDIRLGLSRADQGFRLREEGCTGKALGPGDSCRVEVEFSAAGEGSFDALLEISQADVGTLGIELTGTGAAPRWVLGVDTLEFGDARVDGAVSVLPVEIGNEGSAAAKVSRIELKGADATGFSVAQDRCSGREVSPGGTCPVQVEFKPRREGEHLAELELHMSAGVSPQRVSVAGRAVAPRLSLDREMVDFSRVHRTMSSQVDLSLANRGTAEMTVTAISVGENPTGDFRVLGGSCLGSRRLSPGERCNIMVGFGPTTEGRSTARLLIDHDGISGPRELPMAGIGLAPPIPKLILEDSVIDFGTRPVGTRGTIETVNIRAGGTGSLELREFTLEGPNAGEFQIVPATCHSGPSLQPGSSCAIGLRFVPTGAGPRSARLVLRHNAGSGRDAIELNGEGLGGAPSP